VLRKLLALTLFTVLVFVAGLPLAQPAFASGPQISIQGKNFYKDGKPWILKGIDVETFAKPQSLRAKDTWAMGTRNWWGAPELNAIRSNLGVDTLRITISQAGLDPQSPNYDPNYLSEIQKGVRLGQAYDFVVILDMNAQQDETQELACMPSKSTIRAWKTIAPYFIHDRVMLELFNEPCKSWNEQNKALWAQSMQALIDNVRGLGSTNILLLDGLWFARSTNGLLQLVHESIPNHLALAAHPYFVKDAFVTEKQWHDQFGASAAQYPLIITEWNATSTNGCVDSTTPEIALLLMRYLESLHVGLIGWGLDSNYGKLVKDHTKYDPTDYSTFTDCSKTPGIAGGGRLLADFPND